MRYSSCINFLSFAFFFLALLIHHNTKFCILFLVFLVKLKADIMGEEFFIQFFIRYISIHYLHDISLFFWARKIIMLISFYLCFLTFIIYAFPEHLFMIIHYVVSYETIDKESTLLQVFHKISTKFSWIVFEVSLCEIIIAYAEITTHLHFKK